MDINEWRRRITKYVCKTLPPRVALDELQQHCIVAQRPKKGRFGHLAFFSSVASRRQNKQNMNASVWRETYYPRQAETLKKCTAMVLFYFYFFLKNRSKQTDRGTKILFFLVVMGRSIPNENDNGNRISFFFLSGNEYRDRQK